MHFLTYKISKFFKIHFNFLGRSKGNKGTESGAGANTGAGGGGNTGGGEGDEGTIKLSSQIGSLFEIMTNVLKMTGIGNHKLVLDPISKLVISNKNNCCYYMISKSKISLFMYIFIIL